MSAIPAMFLGLNHPLTKSIHAPAWLDRQAEEEITATRDLEGVASRGLGLRRADALAVELSYHAARHLRGPACILPPHITDPP